MNAKRISVVILSAFAALALTGCRADGGISVSPSPALTSPESTLGNPGRSGKNDLEGGLLGGSGQDGVITDTPRSDDSRGAAADGGGMA